MTFFLLKQLYPPSRSGDLPLPLHTKPSSWTSTNAAGRLERRRSAAAGVVFWQFINGRRSLNWNNIEQQQQCPMSNGCLFFASSTSTSNPPHSSFSSRFAFASVVFPTAAAGTSTMKKLARLQMWWCWRCKNECAINPSPAHQFYDLFFPPSTAAFSFHIYFLLMCVWWSSVGWVTFAGH